MKFVSILMILSTISLKQIVLIRIDGRTNPSEEVFCEDVCTDGKNCLTDEWFVCKWKQIWDPDIICCVNRKTDDKSLFSVSNSVDYQQLYCRNPRASPPSRRGIFSYLQSLAFSPRNRANTHYPWFVSVLVFGRQICAGSVISDYAVLTAAHCFVPIL